MGYAKLGMAMTEKNAPNASFLSDLRYVTPQEVTRGSTEDDFFSAASEKLVADMATEQLNAQFPEKEFFLKKELVQGVMASIEKSSMPSEIGIFAVRGSYLFELLDKSVNFLVSSIATEQRTIENNEALSLWDTVLSDSNRHGLRSHAKIKINEKKMPSKISMRY
jgi:hypothetical protein